MHDRAPVCWALPSSPARTPCTRSNCRRSRPATATAQPPPTHRWLRGRHRRRRHCLCLPPPPARAPRATRRRLGSASPPPSPACGRTPNGQALLWSSRPAASLEQQAGGSGRARDPGREALWSTCVVGSGRRDRDRELPCDCRRPRSPHGHPSDHIKLGASNQRRWQP